MMMWNTVCIESFCFGEQDDKGNYPCGKPYPTHLCLKNSMCPLLMWADTTEREVASFVPLRLLMYDRLLLILHDVYDTLHWVLWGQLWFNKRKVDAYLSSIPVASPNDPIVKDWDDSVKEQTDKFAEWFTGVDNADL